MTNKIPKKELNGRGLDRASLATAARNAMSSLSSGDVLKIIASPGLISDVNSFCREIGASILDQSEGGGEMSFSVRKR